MLQQLTYTYLSKHVKSREDLLLLGIHGEISPSLILKKTLRRILNKKVHVLLWSTINKLKQQCLEEHYQWWLRDFRKTHYVYFLAEERMHVLLGTLITFLPA
ncbi:MAG: hypothetical protein ACTS85_00610 [Arsenophonus sp. NC-PG7-MAG3]